jgi:hypothetical protein
MWFVAEKLKQRGPDRNLYADWIILLKEQFSFRITGVPGLYPLSRILNTRKHNISETGCVSVHR